MNYYHYLKKLTKFLHKEMQKGEEFSFSLHGEDVLSARFNNGEIRHTQKLTQATMNLFFGKFNNMFEADISISFSFEEDKFIISSQLDYMRSILKDFYSRSKNDKFKKGIEHDPFFDKKLNKNKTLEDTMKVVHHQPVSGLLRVGESFFATASSTTNLSYHEKSYFFFNYTCYKVSEPIIYIKNTYHGIIFDKNKLSEMIKKDILVIDKTYNLPVIEIKEDKHTALLAPSAINLLFDDVGKNLDSETVKDKSFFIHQIYDGQTLNDKVNLKINRNLNLMPSFGNLGFKFKNINLIEKGIGKDLVYFDEENKKFNHPSLDVKNILLEPGNLAKKDVLKNLNNGIIINGLHYVGSLDAGFISAVSAGPILIVKDGKIIGRSAKEVRISGKFMDWFGDDLIDFTSKYERILTCIEEGSFKLYQNSMPGALIKNVQII